MLFYDLICILIYGFIYDVLKSYLLDFPFLSPPVNSSFRSTSFSTDLCPQLPKLRFTSFATLKVKEVMPRESIVGLVSLIQFLSK